MQIAENNSLNKSTVNYSQHTITLAKLAVLEHQCIVRGCLGQIQAVKPEQCVAELTELLTEVFDM